MGVWCNWQAVKLMHKKYQDLAFNHPYVLYHWTDPAKHLSMKVHSFISKYRLLTLVFVFLSNWHRGLFWRAIVLRKWVMFFLPFKVFSVYVGCVNMMSCTCAVLRLVRTRKWSSFQNRKTVAIFQRHILFTVLQRVFFLQVFAFRNGCERVAGYSSVEMSK